MPVLQDRVQETTTTGGTGTLTLAGAVTGYRSFNAAFTLGDITYYTIDNGSGEWEIGVGTVGSGTLSRNSVLESSNANALVNFSAGTKRVFCSAPTKVLLPDQTSNSGKVLTTNGTDPSWTTTLNGITLGNITPGSGAFTTLSASSTVSGTGFSTYLASPPAIGGTTPAAGNFTSLGATGNVTLGDASTDTVTINGTATVGTNLTFTGTGNRITGDFSNATGANRVAFQTSTTNGNTVVGIIPNGTSLTSVLNLEGDSTLTNGTTLQLINNFGGVGTDSRIVAGIRGAGTYLPLTFHTGGSERVRIDTSGNVGIGTNLFSLSAAGRGLLEINGLTDSIIGLKYANNVAGYIQANSAAFNIVSSSTQPLYFTAGGTTHPVVFQTNNAERARITSTGNLLVGGTVDPGAGSAGSILIESPTGGLGYGTGSGGTVTQATSKSTTVTLNKPTGKITMNNAALAAGASVNFTLNNSTFGDADVCVVNPLSHDTYTVTVYQSYSGVINIRVTNYSGGSLSDALQIKFAVIKGATS